jgi:hypothetical protein
MTYGVTFELQSEYMETPRRTQLQVKQFQTCTISKKQEKRRLSNTFEICTKLFLVGMKAQ